MGTLLAGTAFALIMGSLVILAAIAAACVAVVVVTTRARRDDDALRDDLERELAKILRHPATQEDPRF